MQCTPRKVLFLLKQDWLRNSKVAIRFHVLIYTAIVSGSVGFILVYCNFLAVLSQHHMVAHEKTVIIVLQIW